jgi:hypothetical protein
MGKLLETFKAIFTNVKDVELTIGQHPDGAFYIMQGAKIFAGPYATAAAAKGQRTRYLKGYTAASRRPA